MSATVALQSNTWPFADLHEDIPYGLFTDAHVVGARACSLTTVTFMDGQLFVALRVTGLGGESIEIASDTFSFSPGAKVEFYNAVGKCFGWLLTGPVAIRSCRTSTTPWPMRYAYQ